jgi:hypothetical protein
MSMPDSVSNVLDREFLGIRCRLIELAASLDRIDRAGGPPADDPRMADIRSSLEVLAGNASDRAEQMQLVFSKRG